MPSRYKRATTLALLALFFLIIPAAGLTVHNAAAGGYCDWAKFIADVTVPDGSSFAPGTAFTKTWQLKNIGTCTWTTSYSLVYVSGEPMGNVVSVNLPSNVAPGQTVNLSVNLTAPSTPSLYRGNWQFKNTTGGLFGIGTNADKPFWVEINVSANYAVVYDFAANACSATWRNEDRALSCPGTDGDGKGFILKMDRPVLENGFQSMDAGLLTVPKQEYDGFIYGVYPPVQVQRDDIFQTTVNCEYGAVNCNVRFVLQYKLSESSGASSLWGYNEKYEGLYYRANVKLNTLEGKAPSFILMVRASGSATGDRALWIHPVIIRPYYGAIVTLTPTKTVVPTTTTSTPGAVTKTPTPNTGCDRATFVSDVTIPDGTVFSPGAAFTKTWRLKNAGTCTWTTSYSLVFVGGEKMGGPDSSALPRTVAPGQTVDLSVNLTAPNISGNYRGYWQLKNASGAIFGIGSTANKPFWVDINVTGTSTVGTAYDFVAEACSAQWTSGAGVLPCPGTDGDSRGFVLKVTNPKLENGTFDTRPGVLTSPQNVYNGYIQGVYPVFRVQSGDHFQSLVNCDYGATSCFVLYRLDYQIGSGPTQNFWSFGERYEGLYFQPELDLSSLAGQDVKFILTILANGTATGDRALWVAPRIVRSTVASTVTATLTPTPTNTSSTPSPTTTPQTPSPTATLVTPSPTATPKTNINVYFTDHARLVAAIQPFEVAVLRTVPATPDLPQAVLTEFFRGPTDAEKAQGLEAVLSGFTGYSNLRIENGIAHVYLTGNCQSNGATYTIAQPIMVNLKQFSQVQYVKIYDQNGSTFDPTGQSNSIPACLQP